MRSRYSWLLPPSAPAPRRSCARPVPHPLGVFFRLRGIGLESVQFLSHLEQPLVERRRPLLNILLGDLLAGVGIEQTPVDQPGLHSSEVLHANDSTLAVQLGARRHEV